MVGEAPTFSPDEKAERLERELLAVTDMPDAFMEKLMEALNNQENTLIERNKLAETFWRAASANPQYLNEIESGLRADQEHISHTGYVLDLIRESRDFFKHFGDDQNQQSRLETMVGSFALRCREQNVGSYFLVKKADVLVSEMHGNSRRTGMDRGMFKISPTHWAAYNQDGLTIDVDPRHLAGNRSGITFDTSALSSLGNREVTSGDLADFAYLQSNAMRNEFTKEFHVELAQLHLPEQFQALSFLKSKTASEIEPVKDFSRKFGVDGMRTFLSLEYGQELGDKLVVLGEKLPVGTAQAIFKKYAEIIEAIERIPTELAKNSDSLEIEKHSGNMRETLVRYGRKLLEQFVIKAEGGLSEEENQKLLTQLDEVRADIVLSASLFKSLLQEGTPIDEISGLNLETVRRDGLTESDKTEMQRIFKENREEYPESLREKTFGDFEGILNEGEREFHIMKKGDEIIGFARFDPLPNGNLYIGSLNVRPEIKSLTVGGAFLAHLLKEKSKTHTLEAEAYSGNKMLKHYTDKYGFKISGKIANYHGSGELFYKMEIPKGSLEPKN